MNELAITLRAAIATDAPFFFEHSRDEDAIRMAMPARRVLDWPAFQRKWDNIIGSDAFFCRTVIEDGEVTGYVAQSGQMGVPTISFWFGQQFGGRGLAQRALDLFLIETATRPLFARVAAENHGSLHVLAHAGFIPVGTGSYFSVPHGKQTSEVILRLNG